MNFTGRYQWVAAPMHHVAPFSQQQPRKELSKPESIYPFTLNEELTIEETKWQEVCTTQNDGQTLNNGDLDSDEHTGTEHDGCNGKAIGVGQIFKPSEGHNDYNCRNHEGPVESRDINLSPDCLRRMDHANRWKRSGVDDLLDKTKSSRNQRLRGDELDDQLVEPEVFERDSITVARRAKTNTILNISEIRGQAL